MKPLILLSNDDGWRAPGLYRLIDCVAPLGDVIAIAPAEPHSGQSSAITVNSPLRITLETKYGETPVYSVTGTPVDCVKLGMHTILADRRPDVMFSGINHGSNSGSSIIYSGTMGAALEATMIGIPAVGFSLLHHSWQADFSQTLPWVKKIAAAVIEKGLPKGICLNVNFPARTEIKDVKVCRAAKGYWTEEYADYVDPHGRPFYWLTGRFHNSEPESTDTDEYWLARQTGSIVPASPDLTVKSEIPVIESILGI